MLGRGAGHPVECIARIFGPNAVLGALYEVAAFVELSNLSNNGSIAIAFGVGF
ncbi:hypothetical protein ABIB38_003785 [Massilia sp. UYP11]